MIYELLSASRSDALAYAWGSVENPLSKLEANTVDTVKLASLALILDEKALDDEQVIACSKRYEDIGNQGENGPWLFACPPELWLPLADLDAGRVLDVAKSWAATEEAQLDRWTVSDTKDFLKSFSKFCATARNEGTEIFLFVAL